MEHKTRLLIVDDSAYVRSTLAKKLGCDPEIEIVGYAQDGIEAVEKTAILKPDVITMDVVMPRMDGITALERIMLECPTPVVMLSALTAEGAESTIKALAMGAVDFFLKHSVASPAGHEETTQELIHKIKGAAGVTISRRKIIAKPRPAHQQIHKPAVRSSSSINRVVIIGSSTGGPQALCELIPALSASIPAPILIVQHMPEGFTRSLADRLNQISEITVKEAQSGDLIWPGQALLAPGGYHMIIAKNGKIGLDKGPTECGVRPSVNITMESVARVYGNSSLGVVLTGMGSDGTRGATLIKAAGGNVIVEDKSTCAIYGMPGSVVEAGAADKVLPLHMMAREITRTCGKKADRHSTVRV
ncbi:MAG: chemotaxis response regulator protein-glutamate methylesterase [Chloroflexota bacterium]|nr:chemotaxis response regulator protein-glutamate methylesterase [Chloroflexota bacterium]